MTRPLHVLARGALGATIAFGAGCTPAFRTSVPRGPEVRCDGTLGSGGVRAWTASPGCHGYCPSYRITLCRDGTVVYDGTIFVKVNGRHSRVLSRPAYESLSATIDGIGDGPGPLQDEMRSMNQHVTVFEPDGRMRWLALESAGRRTSDLFVEAVGAVEWIGTSEEREKLWQESK